MRKVFILLALLGWHFVAGATGEWLATHWQPTYTPATAYVAATATGTVTRIQLTAAGTQQWVVVSCAAGSVLPVADTNTVTVGWATVDAPTNITVLATLSNGVSAAVSSGDWLDSTNMLVLTLSGTVTNLPSVTLGYIYSPQATTLYLPGTAYDLWKFAQLWPAGAILPHTPTNTIAFEFVRSGLVGESMASYTNNASGYAPSSTMWVVPGDTFVLRATRVTNTVPFSGVAERQIR